MNVFQHRGKYIIFKNTSEECQFTPTKMYQDRLWFIVKNIDGSPIERIENLSHVYMNHKHYNLQYDKKIMLELDKCKPSYN
jgi:hypothetical protein